MKQTNGTNNLEHNIYELKKIKVSGLITNLLLWSILCLNLWVILF